MRKQMRIGVGPTAQDVPQLGIDELDDLLEGLWWGENVVWSVDAADAEFELIAQMILAHARASGIFTSITSAESAEEVVGLTARLESEQVSDPHRGQFVIIDLRRTKSPADSVLTGVLQAVLTGGHIAMWICSRKTMPEPVVESAQVVMDFGAGRVRIERADGRSGTLRGIHLPCSVEAGGHVRFGPASAVSRLGQGLRAIRKERGWSQVDLAAMIGVTGSAISQTERGQHSLSLDTVLDLSDKLGVSVDQLVRGRGQTYELNRASHFGRRASTPTTQVSSESPVCVRIPARATASMNADGTFPEMVLVGSGLVQAVLTEESVVLRAGDVLTAYDGSLVSCRNLGDDTALVFWMRSNKNQSELK